MRKIAALRSKERSSHAGLALRAPSIAYVCHTNPDNLFHQGRVSLVEYTCTFFVNGTHHLSCLAPRKYFLSVDDDRHLEICRFHLFQNGLKFLTLFTTWSICFLVKESSSLTIGSFFTVGSRENDIPDKSGLLNFIKLQAFDAILMIVKDQRILICRCPIPQFRVQIQFMLPRKSP